MDEAGNTSKNGTDYFVMVAVIVQRSRHLLETSKLLRDKQKEKKFHKTVHKERLEILNSISYSKTSIVYEAINKKAFCKNHIGCLGNHLYLYTFSCLMNKISDAYGQIDAKIMMDRTRQLNTIDIDSVVNSSLMNITSCKKIDSASNKCIQIADFVAGSIFAKYERGNDDYYNIIKKRIINR